MATKKRFDLQNVYTHMCAVTKDPKLNMEAYILAYKEFNNFFELMGTVFGFVASDVQSKVEILEAFKLGDHGSEFQTIEQMIEFEKNGNKFEDTKYVSGSRTLLRLHRALLFIAQFLEEVIKLDMHEKLASTCQTIYNATLSHHHIWIIRKAAVMAMYALPTKQGLLERIKGADETEEQYATLLPKAVEAMKEVYNRIQKLYETNNILDLP